MTRVYCHNDDCAHCDVDTKMCRADVIYVGCDNESGCNQYLFYLDAKEYGEEFYVLVGKRNKPIGREKCKGKRIEYNGRVFYTREKENDMAQFGVTDAKTGLLVRFAIVRDEWDKFVEAADKHPAIESFPVVEKGDDGEFHVVKGGE